jgi:hypothetical protein
MPGTHLTAKSSSENPVIKEPEERALDNYVQAGNFAPECLRLLKENKPTV